MLEAPSDESVVRPVVVTPTFNNAATLIGVLDRIERLGLPVIAVNDGSTDATAALLSTWADRQYAVRVEVVTHDRNRGKAAAMHSGFDLAARLGFTHAVTIDTDGQLDPEEVPSLLEVAGRDPFALVVGMRDDRTHGGPGRSLWGRRFSALGIWAETGVRVRDSQCGLRVYPLTLVQFVGASAGRFAFETEVITRALWAGFDVKPVPVRSRYLPAGERVSHFRPWVDTMRVMGLHGRLLARALWPWPYRRFDHPGRPPRGSAWEEFKSWLSPRAAWRKLRDDEVGRLSLAAGLAVGTFIANLPIYGFQILASLYVAKRFHLHPLAVVTGSMLSTPPIGPVLIAAAIMVGHLLLHGSLPSAAEYHVGWAALPELFGKVMGEWALGSVIVGLACLTVTFVVSMALLRAVPVGSPAKPAR